MWTKEEEHVIKIEKEYCKENCIDRSVIEPIFIYFCDDDSDDDTGGSIIILSIIDRETRGSQEPVIAHLVFNFTSKVNRKWG